MYLQFQSFQTFSGRLVRRLQDADGIATAWSGFQFQRALWRDATLSVRQQKITLSMAINFVAITLSVLGMLNPITGALVHNAGSVLVVLNAALLYDRKL